MRIIVGPTETCPTGESGGDENVISDNGENWGGLQINYRSHVDKLIAVTGSDNPYLLLDPIVNVEVGHMIWAESGYAPWSCAP